MYVKSTIAKVAVLLHLVFTPAHSQTLWENEDGTNCTVHEITTELVDIIELDSICAGQPPLDTCVVGHWTLDDTSYLASLREMQRGRNIEVQSATVAVQMLINPQGIVRACVGADIYMRTTNHGQTAQTKLTMNGRALSHIALETAEEVRGSACFHPIADEVMSTAEVTVAGHTSRQQIEPMFTPFLVGTKVTCVGDVLTTTSYPPGGQVVRHKYIRVR